MDKLSTLDIPILKRIEKCQRCGRDTVVLRGADLLELNRGSTEKANGNGTYDFMYDAQVTIAVTNRHNCFPTKGPR